ncbi:hypothetical protein AB6D70_10445 [Vibrio splendidus]|nr:hypothetical protein VCRA2117O37_240004 [Vibrio crassostreae]
MQSINITADDIDMIAQSLAMYGFVGLLVALFVYDLLTYFASRFISLLKIKFNLKVNS